MTAINLSQPSTLLALRTLARGICFDSEVTSHVCWENTAQSLEKFADVFPLYNMYAFWVCVYMFMYLCACVFGGQRPVP